jgi:galactokinase
MPEWSPLAAWSEVADPWGSLARHLAEAGVDSRRRAAALRVPGRVELFGKHTDYAGGSSLVTAIDRGFSLLVAPRLDSLAHWRDLGRGVEAQFDLRDPTSKPGHWSNYLRTPARRLTVDFGAPSQGVDVAMVSDLPAAAGLSSSSALVVAAYLAFSAGDRDRGAPSLVDRLPLAAYLGAVESGLPFAGTLAAEGVGTAGGSQDHAAIVCSRAGEVARFGYCPLRLESRFALPADWRLVIGVSGVHAEKSGAARGLYNRLSTLAAEGARAWRRISGAPGATLGDALAAVGGERLERDLAAACPGAAGAAVRQRAHHFMVENGELVPAAARALAAGDAATLGRLAARSQAAAESWLGNQVPETIALARLAREQGAFAASAFGAGFGGSVWALVRASAARRFGGRWRAAYVAAFPEDDRATFLDLEASAGAGWLAAPGSVAGAEGGA